MLEIANALVEKKRKIMAAKAQLEELQDEYGKLEQQMTDKLVESGLQNFKMKDGVSFNLKRDFYGKCKEGMMPGLAAAMFNGGFAELVSVNSATLRGFVNEQIKQNCADMAGKDAAQALLALPDAIQPFVEIADRVSLQVRGVKNGG